SPSSSDSLDGPDSTQIWRKTRGSDHSEYPYHSDFRTSSTSYLPIENSVVKSIDLRISELIGLDYTRAESTQGQYYEPGQTFKPHCDFFHTGHVHWKKVLREGGQRVWTTMAYLDDDMEGGETRFVRAEFSIKPVAGMLLLWNNMTPKGEINWLTLHEGAPVKRGEKTIITRWYRERQWLFPPVDTAAGAELDVVTS
ncbi:MAG: 2OG-Fe(II) oxygenase, partial [Sphingomonas sp.]|uniref:2OG-Fe(II) oxygenase n=1 Tax=Sphingomonas sp. TaxID=28214 RepID=UPI0035A93214|nr:2OG-Fe(II) oxygenase [Sphingomonas sp.]